MTCIRALTRYLILHGSVYDHVVSYRQKNDRTHIKYLIYYNISIFKFSKMKPIKKKLLGTTLKYICKGCAEIIQISVRILATWRNYDETLSLLERFLHNKQK